MATEHQMTEAKYDNLTWHQQRITPADRARLHGHPGATLWFTGLSGSGKSTLANAVAGALHRMGVTTYVLDGDNIRQGLNRDLGFHAEERTENIRRVAEVARLFTDCAVINLVAFISPYRSDRELARQLQPETFIEVFCDAAMAVCESRDPKGLYRRARAGEIDRFTGIHQPYEEPSHPEIHVRTGTCPLDACVHQVIAFLQGRGGIPL
jgi:adenylylsulfate kinase